MASWSLTAPHKRIAHAFRGIAADFTSYHAAFKSHYSKAVADEMNRLQGLDCLDAEDIQRISPAIKDAATCYHSVHWLPLFLKAIRKHYRMQATIIATVIALFVGLCYIVPKPSMAHMIPTNNIWPAIIIFILWIVGALFNSLIPYRYRTFALMVEAAAGFVAVAEFESWSYHIPSVWKSLISSLSLLNPQIRRQMLTAPVAAILQTAVWTVAVLCILLIFCRCVNFWAKVAASGLEFGYRRPAEQCSELTIAFLRISSLVSILLDRMEGTATDDWDFVWVQASKLPSSRTRDHIESDLNKLATLVRKPWRKAMRSRNRPAGFWIASQASRIEFLIRFQQSKNMLAGNNLTELRDSMAHALVQATDGNWHLIGSETAEYSHAALQGRWKMIMRRSVAIALPILGAIAAVHFLHGSYVQAVVLPACLLFAGVQLLGLIDPDSPARLDVAGRVTSLFKHGNG